jgi:hypothetical protein
MTLNLTVLTTATIYQSADFRLTDGRTGKPFPDPSDKMVTISYASWSGFVTYTGVGLDLYGRPVSRLLAEWLTGAEEMSMDEMADLIRSRADTWMGSIRRVHGPYRHTFVLAGFVDQRPRAYVVSNFQRGGGMPFAISSSFIVAPVSARRSTKVIVTGRSDCVPRAARRRLERVIHQRRGDPAYVRNLLQDENRDVADTSCSADTVSPECTVYSCDSAGHVRSIRAEGVPGATLHLHEGIDLNDEIMELARGILGTQKVSATTILSGRSTGGPPVAELPCPVKVIESEESGYRLTDLGTLANRSAAFARAINNAGIIVGEAAHPPNNPALPCLYRDKLWSALPIPDGVHGSATDINDRGEVVGWCAGAPTGRTQHAWFWGTSGVSVDLDGRLGYESAAGAVNSNAWVAGRWRVGEGQKHQFDSFPIVWPTPVSSHAFLSLDDGRWGEAVDLTDTNVALVAIRDGQFKTQVALLYASGELEELPFEDEFVVPQSIDSTNRFILGSIVRPGRGSVESILHDRESGWERVVCPRNSSGRAVNARGDVVGSVQLEGFHRPWFKPLREKVRMLPHVQFHDTMPTEVNERGVIVGTANADHGCHAVMWEPL